MRTTDIHSSTGLIYAMINACHAEVGYVKMQECIKTLQLKLMMKKEEHINSTTHCCLSLHAMRSGRGQDTDVCSPDDYPDCLQKTTWQSQEWLYAACMQ